MENISAFVCVLLLTVVCNGLKLDFDLTTQEKLGPRVACGVLQCTDVSAKSEEGSDARTISSLSIYQSRSLGSGDDSSNTENLLLASLTSRRDRMSSVSDGIKIDGLLNATGSFIRLTMFKAKHCSAEFVCQAHVTTSTGEVIMVANRATEGQHLDTAPRLTAGQSLTPDVSWQILRLVQQQETKLDLASRSAEDLADKIAALENRLEDKIGNVNSQMLDKLATLENRISDKIERDVDDKLVDLRVKISELPRNVESTEGGIKDTINQSLLASLHDFKRELNEALTNMSTASGHFVDIQNATTSKLLSIITNMSQIQTAMGSGHNTVENLVEVLNVTLHTSGNISNAIYDSHTSIEQMLQTHFQQLTASINSRATEIMSAYKLSQQTSSVNASILSNAIIDALTPRRCIKGLFSWVPHQPYPYPVIRPSEGSLLEVPYLCDAVTLGGGWIIIQRRINGDVDFYRDWVAYRNGFGNLDGDFWLGNENIHTIVSSGSYELRVEMIYNGKSSHAQYSTFTVSDEESHYTLTVDGYSGTAGDSLKRHSGKKFSTLDKDNDSSKSLTCAVEREGAWWYADCTDSNLNGRWQESCWTGLCWGKLSTSSSVSYTEMKIRRTGL